MAPTETLGLMLVRAGKITRQQLYEALKAQRTSGQRLGDILFERGWIDEETLTFLLAKQMGIAFLDARSLDSVPEALIQRVPAKLAWEYGVIPVRVWKGKLHVAIADQKTLPYLDELSYFLGRTCAPHLVAASALRKALERYYGPEDGEHPDPDPPDHPPETKTSSDDFAEFQARMSEPRAAPRTRALPEQETDEKGRDFVHIKRDDGSETRIFLLTDVVDEDHGQSAGGGEEPVPQAEPAEEEDPQDTAAILRKQRTGAWPDAKTEVDIQLPGPVTERATQLSADDIEELDDDEPVPTFDIVRAAETIFAATHPDEVAVILVAFARHLLDRTILFDMRDPAAIRVWRHIDSGLDEGFLDEFTATPRELPLLRVAVSSNETFFGPAPSSPMYGAFFERLGMDPPQQILLIPIRALGDTIGVLYGDAIEGGRDEEEFVDLQMLCKEASTGLDMLLSA